jgi:hypothetical protein
MQTPESNSSVGYYFALPRLITSLGGGPTVRSEQNALEAHVVGTLVHAITFVFAATLLLGDRPGWQQIVLLVPVALLVWMWWSLFFYVTSLAVALLRSAGLLRGTPGNHAQSFAVGAVTTVLGWQLVTAGSWPSVLGWIWLAAVALNLVATALLSLRHAEPAG